MTGVVATAPGVDGYGVVTVHGTNQRCYFNPARFVAPWPVPVVGSLVTVANGEAGLVALWFIK